MTTYYLSGGPMNDQLITIDDHNDTYYYKVARMPPLVASPPSEHCLVSISIEIGTYARNYMSTYVYGNFYPMLDWKGWDNELSLPSNPPESEYIVSPIPTVHQEHNQTTAAESPNTGHWMTMDEGKGMLLEELLSDATLEWLEKVKAKK